MSLDRTHFIASSGKLPFYPTADETTSEEQPFYRTSDELENPATIDTRLGTWTTTLAFSARMWCTI